MGNYLSKVTQLILDFSLGCPLKKAVSTGG